MGSVTEETNNLLRKLEQHVFPSPLKSNQDSNAIEGSNEGTNQWSLVQDNQLADTLAIISNAMERRAVEVTSAICSLEKESETVSIAVSSTVNDLLIRSASQFIESRIDSDESIRSVRDRIDNNTVSTGNPRGKSDGAQNRRDIEENAIRDGMNALTIFHDPVRDAQRRQKHRDKKSSDIDGSEDSVSIDYEEVAASDCCYFYESCESDQFNHRPLPYVVGSKEFLESDCAGLGGNCNE